MKLLQIVKPLTNDTQTTEYSETCETNDLANPRFDLNDIWHLHFSFDICIKSYEWDFLKVLWPGHCVQFRPLGNLLRAASELNRNGLCPGRQYDTTQFWKVERAIPASVSSWMPQHLDRVETVKACGQDCGTVSNGRRTLLLGHRRANLTLKL